MNITPAFSCKCCRFYHGYDGVVCGPHPYGPDSQACSDYEPKELDPEQIRITESRTVGWLAHWNSWQKILMLGLLSGSLGCGFMLGWLASAPTQPTTQAPSLSLKAK